MTFKSKQNQQQDLIGNKNGNSMVFRHWLIIVSVTIILNIFIISLAFYFFNLINSQNITIPSPEVGNNINKIDRVMLNKIIQHFEAQKKVGQAWGKNDHILIDPSVAK